jgi:AraC-like DNA-binding protein
MNSCDVPFSLAGAARYAKRDAGVRADAIRHAFPATVGALGGDHKRLLAGEGVDPDLLEAPEGMLPYRAMIALFERAAAELCCPDFGLRLAHRTADALTVAGPLGVAMRNAGTLADAFLYCARYLHVYSEAIHISLERDLWDGRPYLLFDILLDGVPHQRQAMEHALGLTCNAVRQLCRQHRGAAEVWMTHGRPASIGHYVDFFGIPVRFGMPYNAIYFSAGDLTRPIADCEAQIFDQAASYIDRNFPPPEATLTRRIRVMLPRLLATEHCHQDAVAAMLCLHPRTLQRRLREEGTSFAEIIDAVRREVALRNLADTSVPLSRITERLGYSEAAVLTRSCQRWFNRSPRQLRTELA